MSKHQIHHHSTTKDSSSDKSKVNLPIISVVAIIAIILIVMMTVSLKSKLLESGNNNNKITQDVSGQALQVVKIQESLCKIIVGRTTIYDDTTLAVTLGIEETTYYSGYTVKIDYINDEGCTVNVNGNSEYLAIGQIQRLGNVYVTVKGVSN